MIQLENNINYKKISIKEIKGILYYVIDEYNNIIEIPNSQRQKLLYENLLIFLNKKMCLLNSKKEMTIP